MSVSSCWLWLLAHGCMVSVGYVWSSQAACLRGDECCISMSVVNCSHHVLVGMLVVPLSWQTPTCFEWRILWAQAVLLSAGGREKGSKQLLARKRVCVFTNMCDTLVGLWYQPHVGCQQAALSNSTQLTTNTKTVTTLTDVRPSVNYSCIGPFW